MRPVWFPPRPLPARPEPAGQRYEAAGSKAQGTQPPGLTEKGNEGSKGGRGPEHAKWGRVRPHFLWRGGQAPLPPRRDPGSALPLRHSPKLCRVKIAHREEGGARSPSVASAPALG